MCYQIKRRYGKKYRSDKNESNNTISRSNETRTHRNTKELQAMLGCGRKTAVDIGEQAGAKIQIGRRVLWNPIVVKEYIAQISL